MEIAHAPAFRTTPPRPRVFTGFPTFSQLDDEQMGVKGGWTASHTADPAERS
jgi:hypothetical protein